MLAPIAGYPIRGVIWYQGESNAGRAREYETLFPLLIGSWRRAWLRPAPAVPEGGAQVADFAFLWVQLPNFIGQGRPKDYMPPAADAPPADFPLGWAALREVQLKTLAAPHTAMAVSIDIGESWDIHPNNKKTVADRLARAALGSVYGRDVVISGPLYDTMAVEGDRIRLCFRHVGAGLVARGGELRQFAVAGEDRVFVWASAAIDGETVRVWSGRVPRPVAVRYAFFADPQGANLYNADGLPASPFRTDDWPLDPAGPSDRGR
ncbi:MAG: hypothetical protein BWZ02_00485 [Lentisphaerae bacterium ADurb.BinA184]|nr:MAG: hypothetical protein BWZ02_00485 [Lentisphaerae bacterium ADurb.BinA184]